MTPTIPALIAATLAPIEADLEADLAAAERRVEAGFAQVGSATRAELRDVRSLVMASSALSNLAATPDRGWQLSFALVAETDHGQPAAAVGIGYRSQRAFFRVGVGMAQDGEAVVGLSATFLLGE